MDNRTPEYVVLDIETTGLAPHRDRILEVGMVVVDKDLEEIRRDVVLLPFDLLSARGVGDIDQVVLDMHHKNGLWHETTKILARGARENYADFVDREICNMAVRNFPGAVHGKLIMAGNSIHFDRAFLQQHAPNFMKWFHYRVFDIGAFARECRNCGLSVPDFPRDMPHRGLLDAEIELDNWRAVRKALKGGR
jgi:oligoribonuclease